MAPLSSQHHYQPGDRAPFSKSYAECDPRTLEPVRRVLVGRGETFPSPKREGGFFTLVEHAVKQDYVAE